MISGKRAPISLDVERIKQWVTDDMIKARKPMLETVDGLLRRKECQGADFTGWLKPGSIVPPEELSRLKMCVARLQGESDVLLVIGIGGSYLGARAIIEAVSDNPGKVVYAGQNLSPKYLTSLKTQLKGKRVAINLISKSGTTTEPAIAFRLMRDLVAEAPPDAPPLIVATTDAEKGALVQLAETNKYETFVVPDDVGGRFSVLSAVGLLPIAYAGVDIDEFISGAKLCAGDARNPDPELNPAYYYAAARHALYQQGYCVELLADFEPSLHYLAEWWKQLYGESEGKEHVALFPAAASYTTDLHSLGQYMQAGRRILIETFVLMDEGDPSMKIPEREGDVDGLNYLAGKEVGYVNRKAYEATAQAHLEGGVPSMSVHVKDYSPRSIGALVYFFEIACAISGLMLGVNPFDQPGVEAYKNHMFQLLGKPDKSGESSTNPAIS
jgi:glucose-6-phosphate isomerase